MTAKLPTVIAEYFAAANTDGAADRVAACFTEEAVVRDEGGTYRGREAIRGPQVRTQTIERALAAVPVHPPEATVNLHAGERTRDPMRPSAPECKEGSPLGLGYDQFHPGRRIEIEQA